MMLGWLADKEGNSKVGAEARQVEQGKVADVETALRYVEVMVMMTGQKRNIMIT